MSKKFNWENFRQRTAKWEYLYWGKKERESKMKEEDTGKQSLPLS